MSRCQGQCEGKLGNQGDWVKCGRCELKYCYNCAGIKQTTWNAMNDKKKEEWKCKQKCRRGNNQRKQSEQEEENEEGMNQLEQEEEDKVEGKEDDVRQEGEMGKTGGKMEMKENMTESMTRMEKKLDKLIDIHDKQNKKLEEVIQKLEFVSKEQEDLKKENKELKKSIQGMEMRLQELENKEGRREVLESKMKVMQRELKEKEQYDRNKNLEINQLDWLPNENVRNIVQGLAKNFNITHDDVEIETAHRIPNRNKEKASTLIIQFKNRQFRDKWLEQKKRLVTNDNMFRNGNRKRIYINENMTPYTKSLFWKTKTFAKDNNYKYVWFKNGKIMMRESAECETVITIKEEEDLMKLKNTENS